MLLFQTEQQRGLLCSWWDFKAGEKICFLKKEQKNQRKGSKNMTKITLGTLKCIIPHVAVKFLELKFEKDALSWQSQALCDHHYLYVFFSARLCKKYQANFHETW